MIVELFIIIICLLIYIIYDKWQLCKMARELDYYKYEQGIEDIDEEDFYNEW